MLRLKRNLRRSRKLYRFAMILLLILAISLLTFIVQTYWVSFGLSTHKGIQDSAKVWKSQRLEMPFYRLTVRQGGKTHLIAFQSSVLAMVRSLLRFSIDLCRRFHLQCWLDAGTLLAVHRKSVCFTGTRTQIWECWKKTTSAFAI